MHKIMKDHPEWFSTLTHIYAAAECKGGSGGGGGGGGTTTSTNTTTVTVPPKGADELALDAINLRTASRQEMQNLQEMSRLNPRAAREYLNRPTAQSFFNNETFKSEAFQNTLRNALKSPEGFANTELKAAFSEAIGPPNTYTNIARFDTPDFRKALEAALAGEPGTVGGSSGGPVTTYWNDANGQLVGVGPTAPPDAVTSYTSDGSTPGTAGTGSGFESTGFRSALDKVLDVSSPFSGLEQFDTPEFRATLDEAEAANAREKEFTEIIERQLRARLTGEAFLTPEEEAALEKLYSGSLIQGEEALTEYGQQIAAQRGLRTSDSPIGNELIRERGRLELGLQSAKAASSLDLANSQKTFEEGVRQFQQGLRQQAFNNRLSLSTAAPLSFNLSNALAAQRFQGINTTSQGQVNQNNSLGFGQIAGGIGGGLLGLGLGFSGALSSRQG